MIPGLLLAFLVQPPVRLVWDLSKVLFWRFCDKTTTVVVRKFFGAWLYGVRPPHEEASTESRLRKDPVSNFGGREAVLRKLGLSRLLSLGIYDWKDAWFVAAPAAVVCLRFPNLKFSPVSEVIECYVCSIWVIIAFLTGWSLIRSKAFFQASYFDVDGWALLLLKSKVITFCYLAMLGVMGSLICCARAIYLDSISKLFGVLERTLTPFF